MAKMATFVLYFFLPTIKNTHEYHLTFESLPCTKASSQSCTWIATFNMQNSPIHWCACQVTESWGNLSEVKEGDARTGTQWSSFRARLLATLPQMPLSPVLPSLLHLHTAPRDTLLKLLSTLATLLLKASNYSQKTTGKACAFKNVSNCTASHTSLCAHFWFNLSDVCADPRHQLLCTSKGGCTFWTPWHSQMSDVMDPYRGGGSKNRWRCWQWHSLTLARAYIN